MQETQEMQMTKDELLEMLEATARLLIDAVCLNCDKDLTLKIRDDHLRLIGEYYEKDKP